jgi:glycosyltransferase involved in cell wall biosynthesis
MQPGKYYLELSLTDLPGGRINGFDLMRALNSLGQSTKMGVFYRLSTDPNVQVVSNVWAIKAYQSVLSRVEQYLSRPGYLGPAAWELLGSSLFRSAKLVHLHLIPHGWFNLAALPHIARRVPLVWSLHDPWALSGHCVYSMDCQRWLFGCGDCPDLEVDLSLRRDRTRQLWARKKRIYADTPMHLVVVSSWMKDLVEKSPLLRNHPLHLIPLGLDTNVFAPRPKTVAREALGLDSSRPVIAFRGKEASNKFKGVSWAVEALLRSQIPDNTQIVVLDKLDRKFGDQLRSRYDVKELGWVNDVNMPSVLAAADLFLMPSIAEAFGMMAIEAMASGTPLIVFGGTALENIVHENGGGVVVPSRNTEALALAIDELMADPQMRERLAESGRASVAGNYSMELYVRRHIELYEKLLEEDNR